MKLIPATVESWDGVTLRVLIDGYTDGADIGLKAEVCYPFSDRPDYTGFHIEKGDAVWVLPNGGDMGSLIVMGFRNQNTGENKDSRRFRHKNIETHATQNMKQTSQHHDINAASSLNMTSGKITLSGSITINGDIKVNGNMNTSGDIHSDGMITDSDGNNGA